MTARGVLLTLLAGLVLGAAGGLYYSWNVSPVKYVNTSPSTLVRQQRDEYLLLIASGYAVDHDLARAQQRLVAAGDARGLQVGALADTALDEGWDAPRLCALAALAQALRVPTRAASLCPDLAPPTLTPTPTVTDTATPSTTPTARPSATPTRRPTLTLTPRPSATATATPRFLYRVAARQRVCTDEYAGPLIVVLVQDADGHGLAGVPVRVTWAGGSDGFFTGLKPEIDPGYADFSMSPDVAYTVDLPASTTGGSNSPQVADLTAFTCAASEKPGAWRIIFERIE